jgi:hypothetical protein
MVVLVVLVLLVSFSDITFIDVDNLLLLLLLLVNVLTFTLGVLRVKHVDVDMMELKMSSDDDSLIFIVDTVYYSWLLVVCCEWVLRY